MSTIIDQLNEASTSINNAICCLLNARDKFIAESSSTNNQTLRLFKASVEQLEHLRDSRLLRIAEDIHEKVQ